jgi:hypothetical protein
MESRGDKADRATKTFCTEHGLAVKYDRVHRVHGESNFVLVGSEGTFGARSPS